MTDRPPALHDGEALLEQFLGLVTHQIAHALGAGPFGVVVMHAAHDFADLLRLAHFVIGGAQRVIENDNARRAAFGLISASISG